MKRLLKSVVVIWLVLSVQIGFAQYPDLYFKRLPDYVNLSSHYVTHMAQDDDGYIWIGTRDGLNRFDGHEIRVYRAVDNQLNAGLAGNQIEHLLVDSANRLWVVSSDVISVYNREYDRFDIVASPHHPAGLEEFYFNHMEIDLYGRLTLCTGNDLFYFDDATKSFQHLLSTALGYIYSYAFDKQGGIWIGHYNSGGVSYYSDYEADVPLFVLEATLHPSRDQISVIDLEVDDQFLWVGIEHGGIARVDRETGAIQNYFHDTSERFVTRFFTDATGTLWSVDYSGMKVYVEEEDRFHGYYHDSHMPGSIRPNLNGVFQDIQGNYYTYYNGEGVYTSSVARGFQLYNESDYYYWHVRQSNISAVHEDVYGNLWLGGFSGGLTVFNWGSGEILWYPSTENIPGKIGRGSVLSIFQDSKSRMWLGTHNGGLHLYDESSNRFEAWRADGSNGSLSNNDVRAIAEDSRGNLWIGTHGGGVNQFLVDENIFVLYNELNSTLNSEWIHYLMVDRDDKLWIGTAYGLCVMDIESQEFRSFYAEPGNPEAIHGNQVITILESGNGTIWIGTNNGLFRFNKTNETFIRCDQDFRNSYITSIEEDQNGELWVGTLFGLHRYNPETGDLFHFDENDGIQGPGFNNNASYFNGEDILFFAGSGGVNAFNPDNLHYNSTPPELKFSKFLLFNREVTDYESSSVLNKEINWVDEIVLDHTQNFFSFEFVALNMINSHRNEYAVMMEGFDDGWVYIGSRRQVSYTNLSPGRYVFRVKAANNDGIWNEEGISVKVRILPPWYKTVWFYTAITLVILILIISIFRIRTANLIKQKKRLARIVSEQTRKLRKSNRELMHRATELNRINKILEERQKLITDQREELESQADHLQKSNRELIKLINTKDKLFSIIAHDLRSPFNTILGFSSLLSEFSDQDDREQVREHARIIHDSSLVVFNLLENLLYWARTQTNDIQFSPVHTDLNEIVNENFILIDDGAKKKEIEVDVSDYQNLPVFADINMMRTVIRNLLINAVKFTPRGGKISVSSEEINDRVFIYIKDTGVGLGPSDIDQILTLGASSSTKGTEGEKGSGLGLVLCNEFIQKNGGKLLIESKPGLGSSFGFSLPRGVKKI
ncbi:sensor histidine kinase [Alkalitalea saponilacus]|uniref:histidine kinase n=1 Tax=Alkalitalea saponilacus TaxID=889453 RepID=A0A1T5HFM8_9BACT|nr:sensor histidine kinase [Alkalitalea saponilacus]SKC19488.1 Signal transduction histidine kinase [Alkalitalea saponilacus]